MKPVVGYEGLYSVTSCGRVWSHHTQRFLKQSLIANSGLPAVRLCVCGIARTITVQSIVAEAYLSKAVGAERCIRHKDGDKTNNCWLNLERSTMSSILTGGRGRQVICRETGETFRSMAEAAAVKQLPPCYVIRCAKGLTKRNGYGLSFAFV